MFRTVPVVCFLQWSTASQMQRPFSGFLATAILSSVVSVASYVTAQDDNPNSTHPKERRISVVHAHFGTNCAGYLYVSQESVRYEALAPENFKNHSFQIRRAEITALQPWVLMGQVQNLTEIKTAHATYHFWVLPRGTDPAIARTGNLNAIAAPAEKLIAAIRDPESGLEPAAPASANADAARLQTNTASRRQDRVGPGTRTRSHRCRPHTYCPQVRWRVSM